ncbi:MAG: hypothetical protein LBQ33_06075, partial [Oscillospiraceae bacterium]|nr:hypothetical protein [Oscillospiraceae bacterium]
MNLKKLNQRTGAVVGLLLAVMLGFVLTLVHVQLIEGAGYAAADTVKSSKAPIPASRGVILDRNGVPLVENRASTSIVFEHPFFPSKEQKPERNALIAALIALFEEHKTAWIDNLPLRLDSRGQPQFVPGRESDIAALKGKDMLALNEYATAQNCMDALTARYELQDFPPVTARKIASVIYEMERLRYNTGNPYTFAKEADSTLVSRIKENSAFYRGVEAQIVPTRYYPEGTLAPHILGRVAAINAEDY